MITCLKCGRAFNKTPDGKVPWHGKPRKFAGGRVKMVRCPGVAI